MAIEALDRRHEGQLRESALKRMPSTAARTMAASMAGAAEPAAVSSASANRNAATVHAS